MARSEGFDGAPEILSGGGRGWPEAWSSTRVRVAGLGILALVIAAVGGYYLGSDGALHAASKPAADDGTVVMRIPGGRPSGAGLAAGSVWVMTWDGVVDRIDPATREIEAQIPVGEGPLATREGFGSVWVTSALDNSVTRIDPADNSVQETIKVGPVPFQLTVAGGGIWVATQTAAVKIDPMTDRVVLRTPYPHARASENPDTAGVGLAGDDRAVWVSLPNGTVLRIRPDNGRVVDTIRVLPQRHTTPGNVTLDGDSVWVSNTPLDRTRGPGAGRISTGQGIGVVEIDARTNQVNRRVSSGGYPVSGMLPIGNALYMVGGYVASKSSVLIRSDWPYDVLTSLKPVGGNSFDVVAVDDELWVPSWDEHAVYLLPEGQEDDD